MALEENILTKQDCSIPDEFENYFDDEIERKSFDVECKQEEAEDPRFLYFKGYASTYGNIDLGNDIIEKGAFAEALKSKMEIPILSQHDLRVPIGISQKLYEDEKGLIVEGRISKDTNAGRDMAILMRDGVIKKMSIGFRVKEADYNQKNKTRIIKKALLHEISLVTIPMNPKASVLSFKSLEGKNIDNIRTLEKELKGLGCTGSEAKSLISLVKGVVKQDLEAERDALQTKSYNKGYNKAKRDAEVEYYLKSIKNQIINIKNSL
jgi:HK97 family phage prohead protease